MEEVGSRLGRASSRYGPSAAATVFSGPVRRWKKKWVHVSSNHHNSRSQSDGHNNNNTTTSRPLLRRWTPLSAAIAAAAAAPPSEEPPKRRFHYAPIVVVEEQKKAAEKLEQESNTSKAKQLNLWETLKNDELNGGADLKKETQESTVAHLDLGLYLEGGNSDRDSINQSKDAQMKKANSGGFWTG